MEGVAALSFCGECGLLRIRDATDQLQKLFNEKTITPNVCGICKKVVTCQKPGDKSTDQTQRITCEEEGSNESHNNKKEDATQKDDGVSGEICSLKNRDKSQRNASEVGKEKLVEIGAVACNNESAPDTTLGSSSSQEIKLLKPQPDVAKVGRRKRRAVKHSKFLTIKWNAPESSASDDNEEDDDYVVTNSGNDGDDSDDDRMDTTSEKPIQDDVEQDVKITEFISASKEAFEDTLIKTTRRGTLGVDPELLELMVPTDDPAIPFKCKFCDMVPFQKLHTFQNHVKMHTGKEPMRKPYKCDVCGKSFAKVGQLFTHKAAIHSHKRFRCLFPDCKYAFSNKGTMKSHLRVHSGEKTAKCDVCGMGFSSKHSMTIHKTTHSEARPYPCKHCGKTFSHDSYRKSHQRIHNDELKTFTCDTCQYICQDKSALKDHIIQIHLNGGTEEGEIKLDVQDIKQEPDIEPIPAARPTRGLTSTPNEDIDMSDITQWLDPRVLAMMDKPASSDAPFKCKLCKSKDFKTPVPFLRHMNITHPQEEVVTEPYLCNQCDKQFEKHYNLIRHTLCHTGMRPYMCDHQGCNKKFKCKVSLKSHQSVHDVKKHMCSSCGAFFNSSYKLRLHEARVHLGIKPYKCSYCEREFSLEDKKIIHERTHTGEKPYVCDQCGYRCARADYLSKHLRVHTKEKPYSCSYCSETFALRNALVSHEKKHHLMTSVKPPVVTPPSGSPSSSRESADRMSYNALRNSLHVPHERQHHLTSLMPSGVTAGQSSVSDETYATESIAALQYLQHDYN